MQLEADSLGHADLALIIDKTQHYILAEESITIQQEHINRTRERVAMPAKARGGDVPPIAIGTAEDPDLDKGCFQAPLVQQSAGD